MEFPRRAVKVERALAGLLLMAALCAAWVEAGSPLATSIRAGRPWLAWVEARERGDAAAPILHLAVYDSVRRRLALLHIESATKREPRRTLERAYLEALRSTRDPDAAARAAEDLAGARLRALRPEADLDVAGRLEVELPPLAGEDEPAVETAMALKTRLRSPGAWARLALAAAKRAPREGRAALDPLLFALELRRVPLESLAPGRLDEAQAPALLGRLLAPPEPLRGGPRAITAEVLNGANQPGLASRVAKMLRSREIDVLALGTTQARARTLVYDRTGDFRRAALVRSSLDCPSARAVMRGDASRGVDVSVELGADCAGAPGPADVREP